jgi:hypothetical protein
VFRRLRRLSAERLNASPIFPPIDAEGPDQSDVWVFTLFPLFLTLKADFLLLGRGEGIYSV